MRLGTMLIAAAVWCAPAIAQDHGAPVSGESFEAWITDCYGDGYCEARSEDRDGTMRIGRHAEQSYWEISFTGAVAPDQWSDVAVEVDDVTETFLSLQEVGSYGQPGDFYLVGPKAQLVMDRLMPGTVATISYTDARQQPQSMIIDLAGLTAALIWIDGVQLRVGSERVAEAPPHGLTPVFADFGAPPDIPVALLDRHRADPECRPFEDIANGRDFFADIIDADHAIYILPCDSHAYNFTSKVYVVAFDEIHPQYFAEYAGDYGWTGTSVLVNASYDPATRQINSFNKFSSLGVCGSAGLWQWGESSFNMLLFRYNGDCEAIPADDAEIGDYPIVFQSPAYALDEPTP